jgi:hypothetical protein
VYPKLPYRITMQHLRLVPSPGPYPLPACDARLASNTEDSLPPDISLDYVYGAALYQRWKSDQRVHEKLGIPELVL